MLRVRRLTRTRLVMLYIAGFLGFIHFARVAVDNFSDHACTQGPFAPLASVCFLAAITLRQPWGLRGIPTPATDG